MRLENYRQYLIAEFEKRKARNPHYSLRAFARDLGASASRVSEALNGKRGISSALAEHLIKMMSLGETDAKIFRLSVEADHARSPRNKSMAKKELAALLASQEPQLKTFTIVDWVTEAVLKMSEREPVVDHAERVAAVLGIPKFMVVNALRFLTRLGLVKGGKRFKTYLESRGSGRSLNVDYTQILDQAQKAYSYGSSQDDFRHRSFLLEKDDLMQARNIISKSLSEIQKLEKRSKNAEITFVGMQIFSVERQGSKDDKKN